MKNINSVKIYGTSTLKKRFIQNLFSPFFLTESSIPYPDKIKNNETPTPAGYSIPFTHEYCPT